jgi:hypothetical protein
MPYRRIVSQKLTSRMFFCLGLALFFSFWPAGAQQLANSLDERLTGLAPAASVSPQLFNLFDPAKFSMHNAYALSFASDGKRVQSNGLYLNTMQYQFSAPLLFRMKWGLSTPGSMIGAQSFSSRPNLVVPSMELMYHPFKNMLFKIEYSANTASVPYPLSQPNPFSE